MECLEHASDEDLKLYLLQLVQALRYEPGAHDVESPEDDMGNPIIITDVQRPSEPSNSEVKRCALTWFLIRRVVNSVELATVFYWYVTAEADGEGGAGYYFARVRQSFLRELEDTVHGKSIASMLERQIALRRKLLYGLRTAKAMRGHAHIRGLLARDVVEPNVDTKFLPRDLYGISRLPC